jgi:hypothetical protein
VVEVVLDQIDMNQLVDHIPIERIIERVDIQAVMDRIDMGQLVNEVIASVDFGTIVRESTRGVVGETVDAVRVQTIGLDLATARVIDRLLFRKGPRDVVMPDLDLRGPEIPMPGATA